MALAKQRVSASLNPQSLLIALPYTNQDKCSKWVGKELNTGKYSKILGLSTGSR
jgi:hypothetical protein